MILIAVSGSTHTEWVFVEGGQIVERQRTEGVFDANYRKYTFTEQVVATTPEKKRWPHRSSPSLKRLLL